MHTSPIVSVRNLHRSFGKVQAVRGISFEIYPGQVVGFIGANGSGKTTTMRIMATLEVPGEGTAEICGNDIINYPDRVRKKIGWMPDSFGAYPSTTVQDYLDFYGRAFGYRAGQRLDRLREVMEFTDLTSLADRPMNKLSKGMGQRLCLGRTLMHDPEVLLMDEPAAGLDPKARIEFKRLVRLLAEQGKTIFISSHILSELAEMCDSLLFIDAGRIVHHGSAEALQTGAGLSESVVMVQLAGDPALLKKWAAVNPGVALVEMLKTGARIRVGAETPEAAAECLKKMIADGLPVSDFHRETRRLEDAFVEILKQVEPQRATPPPLPRKSDQSDTSDQSDRSNQPAP
jgi:ABC-2 type transport system ATP-binding protein